MCTTPMWLALLLLVGVNGAAVVGEDEGSWAACEGAVCHEVLRQTEGLHRLKLLRGYIIQTMRLMDKLVTSMDEELVQAGKGMADFIGPKCEASHSFLRDIIATTAATDRSDVNENFSSTSQRENLIEDDDDDRWTTQTSSTTFRDEDDSQEDDLQQSSSFIISSSTSSTSSSSGRGFSSQSTTNKAQAHGNSGKDLGGRPSQGSPRPPYVAPETPGATDWRGRGSTEGGRYTWSEGNRGHHGGSGWREGHHRSESTTSRKYYTDASGGTGSGWGGASSGSTGAGRGGANDRNGGTGSGWGGASSGSTGAGWGGASSGNTGAGWGGASSGNTGSGWGGASSGNTGSGWGGANGGNGCRGIPPGSPNWVPGLDQWCAQNCAAGYCPEAQCVC